LRRVRVSCFGHGLKVPFGWFAAMSLSGAG
jgi:hypothetical protein